MSLIMVTGHVLSRPLYIATFRPEDHFVKVLKTRNPLIKTGFRKTLAKKAKGEEEFITLPNSLR